MTQRKRKYAAVGESVRIVTPRQFIRCGYPLSIKDVMNRESLEIEQDFERVFAALENKAALKPSAPESTSDWLEGLAAASIVGASSASATVHGMLCAAIAAYRLEKQNFGGDSRRIIEDGSGPFECGQVWKVTAKRFVKTGKRYASWGGQDSYTGEWDYEPGGLEGEQTHCVYSVERLSHAAKILAVHCESAPDPDLLTPLLTALLTKEA